MIVSKLTMKCEGYLFTCIFLWAYSTLCMCVQCTTVAVTSLGFVVEYAVWRGWHQVIIQTPHNDAECYWTALRLVKCLSVNGVASAVNVKKKSDTNSFLGIVILASTLKGNVKSFTDVVNQLNQWELNTPSYDWLVLAGTVKDYKILSDILNKTALRFDQNIVLGITDEQRLNNYGLCDNNFKYEKNVKTWKSYNNLLNSRANDSYSYYNSHNYNTFYKGNIEPGRNYYKTSERFKDIAKKRKYTALEKVLPLFRSGISNYNLSRIFRSINASNFDLVNVVRKLSDMNKINKTANNVYLIQCFKTRMNSTLYVKYLGAWNVKRSMSSVETPYPVEARNFMREKFIVGRCNCSEESSPALDDDGPSSPELLDDILQFLALRLNATSILRYYNKLGFRTYEGAWTGLLGGLMDHSVDMALEPVTAISPRNKDMDFIFPIADTMCNIYIRHQETSAVRDIFLAPFSSKLIACVVCMVLVAAIAVVAISRNTSTQDARHMSFIEGIIWSTGILCQQGGTSTPQNPAASIVLVVCLFFALVTYNAYAAFITSVLSVRVSTVGSLTDVLQSHLKIGYIRNGADQMYLMSTKDVQLNAFYIRGYSEAENLVSSAEEGLVRAARQDYAFFAGQRVARSTLRSLSQARGRCEVRELPVHSTRAQLAFPLPARSPYARPVLMSLLQLRSAAVLSRLEAALVPAMPQCTPPTGFASARAADVSTALFVILAGLLAGLLLGVAEYIWNNRRKYSSSLRKRFRLF